MPLARPTLAWLLVAATFATTAWAVYSSAKPIPPDPVAVPDTSLRLELSAAKDAKGDDVLLVTLHNDSDKTVLWEKDGPGSLVSIQGLSADGQWSDVPADGPAPSDGFGGYSRSMDRLRAAFVSVAPGARLEGILPLKGFACRFRSGTVHRPSWEQGIVKFNRVALDRATQLRAVYRPNKIEDLAHALTFDNGNAGRGYLPYLRLVSNPIKWKAQP